MRVQNVSSQNFEGKKFRLPVKSIDATDNYYGFAATESKCSVKYFKEYDNPNAEAIYNEAMKIKDPVERANKLAEMGHCTIKKDMSLKERLVNFFDKFTMDYLW